MRCQPGGAWRNSRGIVEFLQSIAVLDQAAFVALLFHSIILAVNLDDAVV